MMTLLKAVIICLLLSAGAIVTIVGILLTCYHLDAPKGLTNVLTYLVGFAFGLTIVYQTRKQYER